MGAFTNIAGGFPLDWQDVSFLNELRGGCAEREEASGGSSPFTADVAAGEDIQSVAFWKAMQESLEGMHTRFVNHGVTIAGAAAVTMFTRATWIDTADLGGPVTTAGDCFRRATTWPTDWTDFDDAAYKTSGTWHGGYIQAGDIIGPWIMDDIQRGLKALQWTTKSTSTGDDYLRRGNWTSPFYNGSNADCDTARTASMDNYDLGWASATYAYHYWATRLKYYVSGGASPVWRFEERRAKGKPKFSGIVVPAGIDYDYDAYLLLDGSGGNPDPDAPGSGWTVAVLNKYDDDGGTAVSDATLTTAYPSEATGDLLAAWGCPLTDGTNTAESLYSDTARLILKWNFTNA